MSIQAQSADGVIHEFPDGTADDVVDRVMKQYAQLQPISWGDTLSQAGTNLLPSAGRFASDIAQPFLHPVETAENIGNLGLGLLEKIQDQYPDKGTPLSRGHEQYPEGVGQYFSDRYGSMENFKHSLASDPAGVAGDLSAIFTGGESALARAPGIVGKAGHVAGKVGRVINPLRLPIKVAKTAGTLGAEALGVTTGAGSKAIETAWRERWLCWRHKNARFSRQAGRDPAR